jgi:hypothetical protein
MRWLEAVVEQAQNPTSENNPGLVLELPGGGWIPVGNTH